MGDSDPKKTLIESLMLVGSPVSVQIESIPDYADIAFEIVQTLLDAFMQLPAIVESGSINNSSIAAILRCYNWINYIGRQNSLLNVKSLRAHASWQKARTLAQNALREMGSDMQAPDLTHITWIEG